MIALLLGLWTANAHELRPGAVALREVAPDVYAVRVEPAHDGTASPVLPRPQFPPACQPDGDLVRCEGGLSGDLLLPGFDRRRVKVVLWLTRLDGTTADVLVPEGHDHAPLPTRPRGVLAWAGAGLAHLAAGADHVLFVASLALVAGTARRVLVAVTGFTAAHAVSLLAASMGWVPAAGPALELMIAASVLLLAREALVPADTLTRRAPALAASGFGLLHGLGFASALLDLGLPPSSALPALAAFHVGVEVGQLGVIAIVGAGAWLARRWGQAEAASTALAWTAGLAAGAWFVERLLVWGRA